MKLTFFFIALSSLLATFDLIGVEKASAFGQSWCYASNANSCVFETANSCQSGANWGDPCSCGLGYNPGDSSECDVYVTY